MDSIKACYNSSPDVRYVLLGSSRIMLLKGIRESLAVRAAIQELHPLTLPELMTTECSDTANPSRLIRWLSDDPQEDPRDYLEGVLSIDDRYALAKEPFIKAQQAIALRTSKQINFAELGRLAGVSSPTAKKFMRYLELSYQVILNSPEAA